MRFLVFLSADSLSLKTRSHQAVLNPAERTLTVLREDDAATAPQFLGLLTEEADTEQISASSHRRHE